VQGSGSPRTGRILNRLISALPPTLGKGILAGCEQVQLALGDVLHEPWEPIREVYFPTHSYIVLVIPAGGEDNLNVGLIGNEGMLGASMILGGEASPFRAQVRGAGTAWQMRAGAFHDAIEQWPAFERVLHRYLQVRFIQFAQMAACTRFHFVEQRLARLLLVTQDRAQASDFFVTHDALAAMLGVRRVGITKAANALKVRNLIQYHRGTVRILDRRGMKRAACSCYQADQDAYARLFSR